MTYYGVIGKETNHSSIFNRSVLDSELSIFDKDKHMNIGKAGQTTISVATTQNMISFIVALILLPFTDMEMRHINFGDKSFSIIADRSEIDYYFSAVFQHEKAQCVNGMLGREIVFAQ